MNQSEEKRSIMAVKTRTVTECDSTLSQTSPSFHVSAVQVF